MVGAGFLEFVGSGVKIAIGNVKGGERKGGRGWLLYPFTLTDWPRLTRL